MGPLPSQGMSAYESCREVCGNFETPGVALDVPAQVDFSKRKTTYDQARIEDELDKLDLTGKNLLHVGVGNSQLAERFASRVNLIDGLTVSPNELARAASLGLPNYTVFLINKYGREFVMANRYDFVIDNNLAGFACCKYHFYSMLDRYVAVMTRGGKILTDQEGMDWTYGDPRWKMTYEDLVGLEARFPLRAARVTDQVYALEHVLPRPSPPVGERAK